ncbi:MAG: FHA domain-containing protein [Patescibacteria group bacterium]
MSRKKAAKTGQARPRIRIENSCFRGLEIPLKKKRVIIGRSLSSDICLDDSLVSDEHAEISRTKDGNFKIKDLNSRNGLQVNSRGAHERILKNGDIIGIGSFQLKFIC